MKNGILLIGKEKNHLLTDTIRKHFLYLKYCNNYLQNIVVMHNTCIDFWGTTTCQPRDRRFLKLGASINTNIYKRMEPDAIGKPLALWVQKIWNTVAQGQKYGLRPSTTLRSQNRVKNTLKYLEETQIYYGI